MLALASATYRPKIALLMRDLLSRYPSTVVGVPMLLYAAPDFVSESNWSSQLSLPFPAVNQEQPCNDLHFLGWLMPAETLPVALPFRPERHPHAVPWWKPTAVVALFRSQPELFDLDTIELPHQWWGSLFRAVAANIHLSARLVLPYPDALEAARTMQSVVRQEPEAECHFLSDTAWSLARDEAYLFQESYKNAFPDV